MTNGRIYSIKKNLMVYTSVFSVLMGCLLMGSGYLIALEESNEILDAQMRYLAEHSTSDHMVTVQSQFDPQKTYHEEDLFVDVWAYQEQSHQAHPLGLLVAPVNKAGFYQQDTPLGKWHTYVLPVKDYQIQVSQQVSVRQALALELAAGIFIPYLVLMIIAILGLNWIINKSFYPLEQFKKELAQRRPQDLQRIESHHYPKEILPTIVEMNRLFEQIESVQQEQKQFIADAAHELRTPITALNLQSKILLNEFPDAKALHNLNQGLTRIQHLVNQLLTLAKHDASGDTKIQYLNVDMQALMHRCIEDLIDLAMQKNIDLGLKKQDDIIAYTDEFAVYSIINNLIDNAIKYTPSNGVINISLVKLNDSFKIIVEDSGVGIEPKLYHDILNRFYRIHQHLEVGSGLGLSIVNKAVEKLNGQLKFDQSEELGGLKVEVELPFLQ